MSPNGSQAGIIDDPTRPKHRSFLMILVFVGLGMAAAAGLRSRPAPLPGASKISEEGGDYDPQFAVAPFELVREDGSAFGRDDLLKKPSVVCFFFASCPGPCRELIAQVKRLQDEFGPRGIQFVSVTVDPENDTPAILTQYAKNAGADAGQWVFLTGTREAVERLAVGSFHVSAGDSGPEGHQITHSDRLMLVGRDGKVHGTYPSREPVRVEMLRKKLRTLTEDSK